MWVDRDLMPMAAAVMRTTVEAAANPREPMVSFIPSMKDRTSHNVSLADSVS